MSRRHDPQYPNMFRKSPWLRSEKVARNGWTPLRTEVRPSYRSTGDEMGLLSFTNTPCQFLNWTLGQRLPAHRQKQTGMTVRDTTFGIGQGPVIQIRLGQLSNTLPTHQC